jgi:hypothetical protein
MPHYSNHEEIKKKDSNISQIKDAANNNILISQSHRDQENTVIIFSE